MTIKKLLQSMNRYFAARESYSHGRKTEVERQRVNDEEDTFGETLVALIDARIAVALADKETPHANGAIDAAAHE